MKSRRLRWAIALALPLAVICVLAIATLAAGVTIDASRWRNVAAQQVSAALARPVALDGALRVTLGRRLVLHLGTARVLSPAGFEATELVTLDDAEIALDLFDLLRGIVRPRSIAASHLTLRLERDVDGRANWAPETPRAPATATSDIDIGQVRIERVTVHQHDARTGTRRIFDGQALSAATGADGSLRLSLLGRIDTSPLIDLQVHGGPLRPLLDGDAPWPFELDAQSSAGRLHADGVFDAGRGEVRADFDATVDDPARLARSLGFDLPRLGAVSLRGAARARAKAIDLTQLSGTLAGTDFSGALALDLAAPRPRLSGAVHLSQLDVGPWIGARAATATQRPEDDGAGWQALTLRKLLALDLDLDLRADHGIGLPVAVRDAKLAVRGDAAGLHAPMSATVAGAHIVGELDLDTAAATPALSLHLATRDQPLGAVGREPWQVQGLDGALGRLDLRISGHGETLGDWAQDLDASLAVTDLSATVRGHRASRPVAIRLENLTLRARRGENLRGYGRVVLAGERVAVALKGGRLAESLRGAAFPIELQATAAPATLRVATELNTAPGPFAGTLRFDFRARRSGDLADWLPVASDSALPLALRGRLQLADEAWHLATTTLVLGRSDLAIEASGPRGQSAAATKLRVRSGLLDVPELLSLRAAADPRSGTTALTLPGAAASIDAQLDLQQVALGRTTLHDVRADARVRQGQLLPAAFSGRVGATAFEGVAELDWRTEPQARLELSARDVELGPLLRELRVADGLVDGRAGSLRLGARARGRHWSEFVESAVLEARLGGGEIAVRATRPGKPAELKLRNAVIDLPPGESLRIHLDGTVEGTPVQIDVRAGTLAQLLGEGDRLPLALSARAPGTLLALDGTLGLPLGSAADLRLQASGRQLDSLSELSPIELPAWGPWSIDGPVRATPAGIELPGLEVRLGNSRLRAEGRLDLGGPRPQLDLYLSSPRLELDDFARPRRDPPEPRQPRSAIGTARDVTQRTGELLVAQWLREFDAKVELQAGEVISSDGLVAKAALRARLHQGRLDVGPAILTLPGGSVRVSMSSELTSSGLDFALAADLDRFDYGFIAAGQGGGDEWHGLVSMKLQLHGSAPSLDTIPLHARGQVDLAVWPNDLRTGQFNLWTVNLLLSVTNLFMPQTPSRLNCIVGRFNFNDGKVTEDQFTIDTTAVRIRGVGGVDLASEELDFVFRPRAKGFAIFRLQQPLRVTGTVSDQRIGTDPRDTPEAVMRLIASPILWPLERWTLGPLPRDGSDVCTDPLRVIPL